MSSLHAGRQKEKGDKVRLQAASELSQRLWAVDSGAVREKKTGWGSGRCEM